MIEVAKPSLGEVEAALTMISVRDLLVSCDIGVHPHEVGRRQSLRVHATLGVATVTKDDLAETFDYNLVALAAAELGQKRTGLIEVFAYRLASALIDHPAVRMVDINVEKPLALENGVPSVRVVLSRSGV